MLHTPGQSRNRLRRSGETNVSLVKKHGSGAFTLHFLTNSRAPSTLTPDQSFSSVHITKAQYVKRKSVSPPVGSEVKLHGRLAQRTLMEAKTDLPSPCWLDPRKAMRPCRSKRVKSSRKMARAIKAVYVTIMCGVSNSDSYAP